MDKLFDQVKYLAKTKFQTLDDLQERQDEIKDRMDELKQERKELYNAHKRALRKEDPHEVEEIEKRQASVSKELKALRKEMAMCYAIARRSGAEEQNPIGKEQNEHEPRRRSSGTNRADVPQRS